MDPLPLKIFIAVLWLKQMDCGSETATTHIKTDHERPYEANGSGSDRDHVNTYRNTNIFFHHNIYHFNIRLKNKERRWRFIATRCIAEQLDPFEIHVVAIAPTVRTLRRKTWVIGLMPLNTKSAEILA